ncbi:MAG: protein phosphatase 2C domain-containing protein [Candidatus Obscuribacterales bacterium]|nr:protein phosphatase 2C domain-containing protein [Candidatus Obscuribacterales bacterium]
MTLGFQFSAGTISGRAHIGSGNLLLGKNNQDGYNLELLPNCSIATVQDGSSSGRHSEVGAKIGGRLICRLIYDYVCNGSIDEIKTKEDGALVFERVRRKFLKRMIQILDYMDIPFCGCGSCVVHERSVSVGQLLKEKEKTSRCCSLDRLVHDYFLFTTVGLVITKQVTLYFSVGDGVYACNGDLNFMGPFPDNAPPYIVYPLTSANYPGDWLRFKVHEVLPTKDLDSGLIATDGLNELLEKANQHLPGKDILVGSVEQFWNNDRFYDDREPELITPWLRQLNSEVVRARHDGAGMHLERSFGLLPDDTTLIAFRKRRA